MSKKKVLLKMIILGNTGVGKTALIHKYVEGNFIEEHKATIGADFLTKEISVDDKLVTLQIWDTAGQERFQSLGTAFYRGADACLLVYDITSQESFDKIDTWKSNFLQQAEPDNPGEFPFLLVGNKCDLDDDRKVSTSTGEDYANNNNMTFYETSALNGNNVDTSIKKIASIASQLETVPYITDVLSDVGGQNIDLEKINTTQDDNENNENGNDGQGCACNLL